MRLRPLFLAAVSLLLVPLIAISARAANEITFEEGIEYSNPDNQHLELNLAGRKRRKGNCRP